MLDATFTGPDLTTFICLDDLGLEVIGQQVEPDRAVLACRVLEPDDWCRRCGSQGLARDTVVRRLAHEPFGWRPTTLLVTVHRHRCTGCGHVWRQDTPAAAQPRAKISRAGLRWALVGIVCQHLSMARVEPGSTHDITAARTHAFPALYPAAQGLPTLTDKGYTGAGIGIIVHRHNLLHPTGTGVVQHQVHHQVHRGGNGRHHENGSPGYGRATCKPSSVAGARFPHRQDNGDPR